MVHEVTPKAFLVGASSMFENEMFNYLQQMGVDEAFFENLTESEPEALTEIYSRSCYKSFQPGLNPNVTRVRPSNQEHLANILAVNHGSVLEHVSFNWFFTDVSIVFTQELIRHRVGTAISQESLRFVRLTDLGQWVPECFADMPEAKLLFQDAFFEAEQMYKDLLTWAAAKEGADSFDDIKDFNTKKLYTSAARRVAPIGLASNIGWTCNMRELRHVLALRTSPAAEEEMRLIFGAVGHIMKERYPNFFQDFHDHQDGPYTIWCQSH